MLKIKYNDSYLTVHLLTTEDLPVHENTPGSTRKQESTKGAWFFTFKTLWSCGSEQGCAWTGVTVTLLAMC